MGSIPRLIIDTDMSLDDLMAILYLLKHPDVEVIGVSITGAGVAHCEQGAYNALRLLRLAEKERERIPVACGDEEPSDGYHAFPKSWREAADALYGVRLPYGPGKPVEQHAVDLMISLIENSDEPVKILGIGPLTNIAELIETQPTIQDKIERIFIMAGALRVKGDVIVPGFTDHLKNEVTDWNSYIDPLATQKVFRSSVPITLIPLDVTNKLPITREFTKLFSGRAKSPEASFLAKVFDNEMDLIESGVYYFWDLLAASAIVDRDICHLERLKLDVVVKYDEESPGKILPPFSKIRKDGQPRRHFDLYVSGQIIESEDGKWTEVCTDVNAETFFECFSQVINRQYQT